MNNQENTFLENESWERLTITKGKQLHQELKELRRLIKLWRDEELQLKFDNSQKAILLQYASYLEEYNNIDTLKGSFFIEPIHYKQNLKNVKSEKEIFLGITFLFQKMWKLNFKKQFISKLSELVEQQVFNIFLKLKLFAEGFMNFTQGYNFLESYETITKYCIKYYTHQLEIDQDIYFLLLSIGVHRIPHYRFNGGKIQSFDYVYMINCEDFIHNAVYHNEKKMSKIINDLESSLEEDPRINYSKEKLIMDENMMNMNKKIAYFHEKKNGDNLQKIMKVHPTLYKKQILADIADDNALQLEIEDFQFMLERYFEFQARHQYLNKISTDKSMDPKNCNRNIMIEDLELQLAKNQRVQFKNHAKILDSLEKIPNFKYALTNQQRQVLCSQGNLIIVGRSGTGKTTCAMLRLYGIQFSIKIKEYNSRKKQEKIKETSEKCIMAHLDEIQLTKSIFLTFSGILIDEITKQYDDMVYQIKEKHSKKCTNCIKTLGQKTTQKSNEDPIDKLRRLQQQQEKQVISLSSIKVNDFPGFFMIENFIRVIDKTIKRPFYSHENQKKDQNNAQIKRAYINNYEYTPKEIILTESFQAIYVNFTFFQKHIWDKLPKQLIKATKQYCLLTPSVVWSEIFSILKGSLNSYLYPRGYISLRTYMENSQSIFQSQSQKMFQYKKKVYKILKSYTHWCKIERAYDLLDVVNHNLREIQYYNYQGPMINYMFIDQIQDLTASTALLISKMVINNIFYCGDTAQAITKGVSFRFDDLKLLFNKKYCRSALTLSPPEDIKNLTVNFRSHNFILQIANSILSSIQQLFPNSINKLKKEYSDLLGPKSFLLLNQDQSVLFQLICGDIDEIQENTTDMDINLRDLVNESQMKGKTQEELSVIKKCNQKLLEQEKGEQSRKFNNQQVIVVRNQEEKQKLPVSLKRGIVLTPQKAKGLEYDQVILYNFFSSCPIYEKWNSLLQHLECFQVYEDEKQFEKQLSRRNQQEKKQQQMLSQKVKQLLGFNSQKRQYKTWGIKLKQSFKGISINLYHEIATQLKILYTIITRARSVFIIFDTKIPKNLLRIWEAMNLITFIDENNVRISHLNIKQYVQVNEKHVKYVNLAQHWFKAGCDMLARKDYQNAKKCFKNINRIDLVERIESLQMEIQAEHRLYQINTELDKLSVLAKDDRKIVKVRLQKQRKETFKMYLNAAKIYEKWNRNNDAAQAYFKSECYQQALKYYRMAGNINNSYKIALCCKKLKLFKQALKQFEEINDVEGIIECYIELQQWALLLEQIIAHPQYINKYNQCNISLNCIKNAIHSVIRKKTGFQELLSNSSIQEEEWKKRNIYNEEQFSSEIYKIIFESEQSTLKELHENLIASKMKYQQLQQTYHYFQLQDSKQGQQMMKCQDQKLSLKYQLQKIVSEKDVLNSNLQRYKQSLPETLKHNRKYNELIEQLQHKQYQQLQLNKTLKKISEEINIFAESKQMTKKHLKNIQLQLNNYDQLYNYKNIDKDIAFALKKIKENKSKYNKLKNNQNYHILKEKNYLLQKNHDESESLSHVQKFQDRNNIGGMRLPKQRKDYIINEITRILQASQKLIQYPIQESYEAYHHRFIQQKLFRHLADSCEGIYMLKKCNVIGDNVTCLLFCDYYKQLVCLSPKYILGVLLEYSKNFKESRHFKNQIYQNEAVNINSLANQGYITSKDRDYMKKIESMLIALKDNGLKHRIPRVAFENIYYYESIMAQVSFGLILQGYYRQALMFCSVNLAWKLSYLFFNETKMSFFFKKMALKFGKLKFKGSEFLFIQDQFLLEKMPEAQKLNIFSIQKIFFTFDYCQNQPFLSKKKVEENFQVQQETVKRIYHGDAMQRIAQARIKHYYTTNKIVILEEQIKAFEFEKIRLQKQAFLVNNDIIELKRAKIRLYKEQQRELYDFRPLEQQLSKAQLALARVTIPRKQKVKFEEEINLLQKLINNGSSQQNQKLNQLNLQYKKKISQQKLAYQKCESLKDMVAAKQSKLNQIHSQINQIVQRTRTLEYSISLLNQNNISDLIDRKKKEVFNLRSQIPQEIYIQNPNQLIQAFVKKLMKEQQAKRYGQWLKAIRQENMDKLQAKSNIPESSQYQFLKIFIQGRIIRNHPSFNHTCKLFYSILLNFSHIQQFEVQQSKTVELCNVIMMYLGYIFSKTFRNDVNYILQCIGIDFERDYQNRIQISQNINYLQQIIQFCENNLQQTPFHSMGKRNQLSFKKQQAEYNIAYFYQMLKVTPTYSTNPNELIKNFLAFITNKIYSLLTPESKFLNLLFGFFQCRIIRQCQNLNFLAEKFVLVMHNSIIIEKLKDDAFAYYFDQQNEVILCRYEDVSKIIFDSIIQKYCDVYNCPFSAQDWTMPHFNINGRFPIRSQKDEGLKLALKFTQFAYSSEKQMIKNVFNNFIGNSMLKIIQASKSKVLEYYLKSKFEIPDSFFFASHQLREYYFLERLLINLQSFNYKVLKNVERKVKILEQEYQKFINKQKIKKSQ